MGHRNRRLVGGDDSPRTRVLDVGCGYGRITLPLARKDYRVEGLDHSPELLTTARELGQAEGLNVSFTLGSMTSLPYEESSYGAVICLWSAFNELLEEHEQLTALGEMWRVLEPGGFALAEGRPYTEASEQEIGTGLRRGPGHRLERNVVEGLPKSPLPPRRNESFAPVPWIRYRRRRDLDSTLGRPGPADPLHPKRTSGRLVTLVFLGARRSAAGAGLGPAGGSPRQERVQQDRSCRLLKPESLSAAGKEGANGGTRGSPVKRG
jgi:SAM-dependent methyltransferase